MDRISDHGGQLNTGNMVGQIDRISCYLAKWANYLVRVEKVKEVLDFAEVLLAQRYESIPSKNLLNITFKIKKG